MKNAALLAATEAAGFNIFITGDRNLEYQQNPAGRQFGVIVVAAVSNTLEDLTPLIPEILTAITQVQPGQVVRVPRSDSGR